MAWIESHQSNRDHPKIIRAARALGISKVTMLGHLHLLWYWALDYAQDGNLAAFEPADIADAAEWTGDAEAFVRALTESASIGAKPGLLEYQAGMLRIHDWYDYAGKLIDRRREDAERKRASRGADAPKMSGGHPLDVNAPSFVPYPTLPNPTIPNQEEEGAPPSAAWQAFTKARGPNLTASDSEYIAEFVTLYGDAETAQAIVYCDKNKRDNFLRINYIQTILSSWQAEGSLGLHTPEYEAHKPGRKNGNRAEPESNQAKLARVYAEMEAEKVDIWQPS